MYNRGLTLLLLMFASVLVLHGQESAIQRSDSIAKIEGRLYVIHTVKPKQTLFSIAKAYEVKLSSIVFDNPGIIDGIQPDQHLRIDKARIGETVATTAGESQLGLDGQFILYEVPSKKTLYAISKEFNTTIGALMDANPELANGLKVGSTIRIPSERLLQVASTEKVAMVGLPDMVKSPMVMTPQAFNVVLLIPFYSDENDTLIARLKFGEQEKVFERSEMGLHFYEGVLLAIDSLTKLGYDINLKVIDTENRPWKVEQIINNGGLDKAHLVIGPFYAKVFEVASSFCKTKCIPIISPTIQGKNILEGNPYVFKVTPTTERMVASMGEFLAKSDSTKNMILHYGRSDEQLFLWRFRQGLDASAGNKVAKFPAYNILKTPRDSIRLMLSLSKRNNLIVLSENEVNAATLVRSLSNWSDDAKIVVFVPDSWNRFKSLDMDHFDRLRMHLPMAYFVDYSNVPVQKFVQKFRRVFHTEPSTFAFRGYDIAMHFLQNLDGIRKEGPEYMLSVKESGLQNDFRWANENGNGHENTTSRIVDHTDLLLKIATE